MMIISLLALGRRGNKNNRGKESVHKTEVTTSRRAAHVHARKCTQRKVTVGGGATRVWEKDLR
jgi:hypothetical protein